MSDYKLVLKHHGILGQKWGVRRFQNADGTRTAAGKKRYNTRYVTPDGKHLTNRGANKSISTMQKDMRFARDVDKIADKYAKKQSDKAYGYLRKANESERGSEQEAHMMSKYKQHIDRARAYERGASAVKRAHETVGKTKIKSLTDPSAKNSPEYKEAKKLVRQYNNARGADLWYFNGMFLDAGETGYRGKQLYRVGKQTKRKPKYGYTYGEDYIYYNG